MSTTIKNSTEIELMRKSGEILGKTLDFIIEKAIPGVSTLELDQEAEKFIRSLGGTPAFKGFNGYPFTICAAIDEIVVHGIPSKDQILKEGDLFTADCGVDYQGFKTDAARSIGIGSISQEKESLINTAKKALAEGIKAAKPGSPVFKIGEAIEEVIERNNFKVIYDLTGHGIGKSLHEDPIILNYKDRSIKTILKPGMTIAIEPIFAVGSHEIITLKDDWTIVTSDGSASIQEERTILITETGNEILTKTG